MKSNGCRDVQHIYSTLTTIIISFKHLEQNKKNSDLFAQWSYRLEEIVEEVACRSAE